MYGPRFIKPLVARVSEMRVCPVLGCNGTSAPPPFDPIRFGLCAKRNAAAEPLLVRRGYGAMDRGELLFALRAFDHVRGDDVTSEENILLARHHFYPAHHSGVPWVRWSHGGSGEVLPRWRAVQIAYDYDRAKAA